MCVWGFQRATCGEYNLPGKFGDSQLDVTVSLDKAAAGWITMFTVIGRSGAAR